MLPSIVLTITIFLQVFSIFFLLLFGFALVFHVLLSRKANVSLLFSRDYLLFIYVLKKRNVWRKLDGSQ